MGMPHLDGASVKSRSNLKRTRSNDPRPRTLTSSRQGPAGRRSLQRWPSCMRLATHSLLRRRSVDPGLKGACTPKLRASASSGRTDRHGSLWSTASIAWLMPVGVQRGIRAPGRSADPPSWLTFVGRGSGGLLRGWLPAVICGRELSRVWAVRGCSTSANDDQRRPPGARAHRP